MAFQLENIHRSQYKKEHKTRTSVLQREITWLAKTFSNKIKEEIYTELSVLLKAGITLKDALELISNAQKKKRTKEHLELITEAIVAGESLSEAINKHSEFTNYEYHSLKIGEETGTLTQVTEQLGQFYTRKNEQRRQLISALTYPIIILVTAILVVTFMLNFVVPMFVDIFEQQNVELPGVTKFIISLSNGLKEYGWFLLILIIGLIVLFRFLRNKATFKRLKDQFVIRIPFVGHFVKTICLSQFTQAVSLLTASKVPVVNSIQLVKQMINFHPLQRALNSVEQQLLQGKSLSQSLDEHELFDAKMVALVKVAEETNQNEFIFQRLNEQYNTQVQQKSKLLSTLMEPIIILVVGVLVAVILIAMYLPMFRLSSVMT